MNSEHNLYNLPIATKTAQQQNKLGRIQKPNRKKNTTQNSAQGLRNRNQHCAERTATSNTTNEILYTKGNPKHSVRKPQPKESP
jgi:hypothetical protein